MSNLSQLIHRFQAILVTIQAGFFLQLLRKKNDSKIYMEIYKGLQEAFDFAKEQRGFTLTNFQTTGQYGLPRIIKVIQYWPRDRQVDQWNRVQKQTRAYGQLIFGKAVKEFNGERILFLTTGAGQLDIHMENMSRVFNSLFQSALACYATCIGWKGRKRGLKMCIFICDMNLTPIQVYQDIFCSNYLNKLIKCRIYISTETC